jgi:AraC-like DNA-binding protein
MPQTLHFRPILAAFDDSVTNLNTSGQPDGEAPGRPSSALSPSRAGDVRIGPILAIPAVLKARGANPKIVFAAAGVELELFRDPDIRLPLEAVGRLFDACAALIRCDHFGLLVGDRFDLQGLGPIGELMRNSATVGDALRVLLRHLHLHDRGAAPVLLTIDASCAILGYSVLRHGVPGTHHIHDAAIAIAYRILRALGGPSFAPLRVQFSYGVPRSMALHGRIFRCGVAFEADLSGVVLDRALLAKPIDGADANIRKTLQRAILDAEAEGPMTFGERLESALHQFVLSGDASAEEICRQFAISERTLRRRLEEEGKNLQQVVGQTKFELARQLLRNTKLPVSKIASTLYYADPNAFSRAFRNWAGNSPKQWRALDNDSENRTAITSI